MKDDREEEHIDLSAARADFYFRVFERLKKRIIKKIFKKNKETYDKDICILFTINPQHIANVDE